MKNFLLSLCAFLLCNALQAEKTFSMIKPTAVKEHHIGGIIDLIEKANLSVVALKMQNITKEQAESFYGEHKGKPFYADLVNMMSSGPVVLMVIEGDNAVMHLREIVGSTDPKKASAGTIRATFGKSVGENAIHASDSTESAKREITFFFAGDAIL